MSTVEYCIDNALIMKEWDYSKNSLNPITTRSSLKEKAYFRCILHSFSYTILISSKRRGSTKCHACLGLVQKGVNDLVTLFPHKMKFFSETNDFDPSWMNLGAYPITLICENCSENYTMKSIHSLPRTTNICTSCYKKKTENNKRVRKEKDVIRQNMLIKDFYPHIEKYWSSYNTVNFEEALLLDKYLWQKKYKVKEMFAKELAEGKEPFKKNSCKIIEGFNRVKDVYSDSIIDYIVNEEDKNLHCDSTQKIEWRCKNHFETYFSYLFNVKEGQYPPNCPYCSGHWFMSGVNDIMTRYPEVLEKWSWKNIITPNLLFPSSKEIIIWECSIHGDYKKTCKEVLIEKHQCPSCVKSGFSLEEKDLLREIKKFYKKEIVENSRKIIPPLELDLFFPDLDKAIEYNGVYWHSFEDRKQNDVKKIKLCKDKNIELIVVTDEEWKNNKYSVLANIENFL